MMIDRCPHFVVTYTKPYGGHTFPHKFDSARAALAYLRQKHGWEIEHSNGQVWPTFRDSIGPQFEARMMCEIKQCL